jgi:hypothetical protein
MATQRLGTARANIRVIEDAEAQGEVAKIYEEWRASSGRELVPGIYKCFSARPDVLRLIMAWANALHFSEGHLTRRTKEAIATYVSALNHCPY